MFGSSLSTLAGMTSSPMNLRTRAIRLMVLGQTDCPEKNSSNVQANDQTSDADVADMLPSIDVQHSGGMYVTVPLAGKSVARDMVDLVLMCARPRSHKYGFFVFDST